MLESKNWHQELTIISEIEKYERALEKQNIENKITPDKKEFERKTFTQERDFFQQKLSELEAEELKLNESLDAELADGKITNEQAEKQKRDLLIRKQFFEKQLKRVEHDIWILNKNKYDLIKFVPHS
jgi:hypothetical protein